MDESGGDMDIDQCLIGKFSSLGTTDKDVLIGEFRKLLGFQLNAAGCEFFLSMTNWNLHAAIGAYYDFEMPSGKIPIMSFVSDVTIGEGEAVPPDTDFVKTWRIQNTGSEQWPSGCTLRYVNGDKMGAPDWVSVEALNCGQTTDVSVKMQSPSNVGIYQGQWKIYTKSMVPFGDTIWVIISVEMGGLLGVTQQMSQIGRTLGTPDRVLFDTLTDKNPFSEKRNCNQASLFFGNAENVFKSISSVGISNNANDIQEMDMGDKDDVNRNLTATPELNPAVHKVVYSEPSGSCWNTKSPTLSYGQLENLHGTSHSLHCITEESSSNVSCTTNSLNSSFLTSQSSYDLSARQATPCNSPTQLLELERSFTSPDAPSPIKPTSPSLICQNSPKSAHRLDFSGGP